MSPLVFLLVAAAAAFGLYRTMRSRNENVRYLEEAGEEAPLSISHLSRPLQKLARETRSLRLSLEEPKRQLRTLPSRMSPEFDGRAIDQMLMNSSREIGEWLNTLHRLGEEDREHLIDVGANAAAVRDAFAAEDFALELGSGGSKRAGQLVEHVGKIQRELDRIEKALQLQTDPYR